MPEKLKDTLFPRKVFDDLIVSIRKVYPSFDGDGFTSMAYGGQWENLELKQRISRITVCLKEFLPEDYNRSIDIMEQVSEGFRGIVALSFSEYVEKFGQHDWETSMRALGVFTKSCSSEFAIRPFLHAEPVKGMKQMMEWSRYENEQVRRLSSEGCRPRLPWGMALPKFKKDPSPIIPILENLKDDPSEFVRRSVANNLNDISKDNPEVVLDLCEKWQGQSANVDRIIKHACRSLLKDGNKRAMLLFGFGDPKNIEVQTFTANHVNPKIGEAVQLSFTLAVNEKKKKKIRLEYIVHYIKSNGKPSPKVFQISEKTYGQGAHEISKKHDFANQSTRTHYPGLHKIDLIVNGEKKAELSINLY